MESFNEKMRDELLNREIFYTLRKRHGIDRGVEEGIQPGAPDSALGYRPPAPEAIQGSPITASLVTNQRVTLT